MLQSITMQEPLYCLWLFFYTLPKLMSPLKHFLQQNLTCPLTCSIQRNIPSYKTAFIKTSCDTTEFPKKSEIQIYHIRHRVEGCSWGLVVSAFLPVLSKATMSKRGQKPSWIAQVIIKYKHQETVLRKVIFPFLLNTDSL